MIRSLAVAACTALLVVGVAPPAAGHEGVAPNKCGKKRATTELLSDGVRVVYVFKQGDEEFIYYACRLDTPTRHDRKHGFSDRRRIAVVPCIYACSVDLAFQDHVDPKVALAGAQCSS